MGKLDGKVAIITGAASGMGLTHARKFIEEGAKIIIADIAEAEGHELAKELGDNARFIKMDITKAEEWEKAVSIAEETYGPVNVLVNNAGIGIFKMIDVMTESDYRKTMDVNALSVFLSLKAVVPSMKKAGKGSIINISSVDGLRGAPTATAYCASKFAVNGITRCAAIEYGPMDIRVNTVHPGVIATPMSEQGDVAEIVKELEKGIPMKRSGKTEEVSNLVIFLASDDSSYCTGSEFVIDGGMITDL
ncbi:SDR family NAD(P)-dependent oxidoreductase [Parasporobacterium paucivorans]|uniref:3alpha(Or 20beta)-hydroxysteroid dehydrogenase n=1 Tax=Parasporobacterium paucivorans DSM 15970 TaxID=1122934 RepID=A0A1M6HC55_9FIRM|nr:glucose 1-dehydrogenase [Parasporobacterium paucivorans]SHJ19751.1 3alpha(or 20beta)-hydroxysteroid dehydrogenase [Parasporobacterium paucivorans DSM 15970]